MALDASSFLFLLEGTRCCLVKRCRALLRFPVCSQIAARSLEQSEMQGDLFTTNTCSMANIVRQSQSAANRSSGNLLPCRISPGYFDLRDLNPHSRSIRLSVNFGKFFELPEFCLVFRVNTSSMRASHATEL